MALATSKPSNREIARLFDEAAADYDRRSNPYTMRRRAEALAAHVRGRSLELGGGTAAVTALLPDPSRALLSDISARMCRLAGAKVDCPRVCFDAEVIPLADNSIDTAVSAEMIYYLDHPDRFVTEAHRVLRPGGKLVLSTTNPTMAFLDRGRAVLRRLGFRRMFFDDGSPRFIPLPRVLGMLERAGFTVELTRHIVILPFASLDVLNRFLERTALRRYGLFMVVVATKR